MDKNTTITIDNIFSGGSKCLIDNNTDNQIDLKVEPSILLINPTSSTNYPPKLSGFIKPVVFSNKLMEVTIDLDSIICDDHFENLSFSLFNISL